MHHKQSVLLTWFYNDYAQWIANGANEDNPFSFTRGTGLCNNIVHWVHTKSFLALFSVSPIKVQRELWDQFYEDGLSLPAPFNNSDAPYWMECLAECCHENEDRNNWVNDHKKRLAFWQKALFFFNGTFGKKSLTIPASV